LSDILNVEITSSEVRADIIHNKHSYES